MLYNDSDINIIRKQQWSIIVFFAVFSVFMIWLFSYFIIKRAFWPAYGVLTFLVFVLLVVWIEFLQPRISMGSLINKANEGLGVYSEVTYIRKNDTKVIRLGQEFYELYFDEIVEEQHYERKVYLEVKRNFTPLIEGKSYKYKTIEKFVISLESVE